MHSSAAWRPGVNLQASGPWLCVAGSHRFCVSVAWRSWSSYMNDFRPMALRRWFSPALLFSIMSGSPDTSLKKCFRSMTLRRRFSPVLLFIGVPPHFRAIWQAFQRQGWEISGRRAHRYGQSRCKNRAKQTWRPSEDAPRVFGYAKYSTNPLYRR